MIFELFTVYLTTIKQHSSFLHRTFLLAVNFNFLKNEKTRTKTLLILLACAVCHAQQLVPSETNSPELYLSIESLGSF